VSITLPGPLEGVLSLVGVPWVDIDEDDLRALAWSLRSYAGELREHRDSAGRRLASTAVDTESEAYDALVDHYADMSRGHLEETCRILEDMAGGLDLAGTVVHEVKLGIIGALGVAAGEMATAAAASVITFGLSMTAEAAIVGLARTVISRLVSQLEQDAVGTLVDRVFGSMLDELDDRVGALIFQGAEQILR
jgi:hypothetical protein